MKLQVVSDVHLEFEDSKPLTIQPNGDALALVGDVGYPSYPSYGRLLFDMADKFPQVYVIAGNHEFYRDEYYDTKKQIASICDQRSNLHFLDGQKSHVFGSNDKVRIIGCTLWSSIPESDKENVYRYLNDYRYIKIYDKRIGKARHLTIDDTNRFHMDDIRFIEQELQKARENGEKAVILTHHAPLMRGCSDPIYDGSPANSAFQTPLQHLMNPNVKLWVYGHTHYNADLMVNGTRVVANQRGYTSEKTGGWDPERIFEV